MNSGRLNRLTFTFTPPVWLMPNRRQRCRIRSILDLSSKGATKNRIHTRQTKRSTKTTATLTTKQPNNLNKCFQHYTLLFLPLKNKGGGLCKGFVFSVTHAKATKGFLVRNRQGPSKQMRLLCQVNSSSFDDIGSRIDGNALKSTDPQDCLNIIDFLDRVAEDLGVDLSDPEVDIEAFVEAHYKRYQDYLYYQRLLAEYKRLVAEDQKKQRLKLCKQLITKNKYKLKDLLKYQLSQEVKKPLPERSLMDLNSAMLSYHAKQKFKQQFKRCASLVLPVQIFALEKQQGPSRSRSRREEAKFVGPTLCWPQEVGLKQKKASGFVVLSHSQYYSGLPIKNKVESKTSHPLSNHLSDWQKFYAVQKQSITKKLHKFEIYLDISVIANFIVKYVKQGFYRRPIVSAPTSFSLSLQSPVNLLINIHKTAIQLNFPKPNLKNFKVQNGKTLNYYTMEPEPGGLFCNDIFGYGEQRFKRRRQFGYIELTRAVTHVWYLRGIQNYLGIVLNRKKKQLERLAYCVDVATISPQQISNGLVTQQQVDSVVVNNRFKFHFESQTTAYFIKKNKTRLIETTLAYEMRKTESSFLSRRDLNQTKKNHSISPDKFRKRFSQSKRTIGQLNQQQTPWHKNNQLYQWRINEKAICDPSLIFYDLQPNQQNKDKLYQAKRRFFKTVEFLKIEDQWANFLINHCNTNSSKPCVDFNNPTLNMCFAPSEQNLGYKPSEKVNSKHIVKKDFDIQNVDCSEFASPIGKHKYDFDFDVKQKKINVLFFNYSQKQNIHLWTNRVLKPTAFHANGNLGWDLYDQRVQFEPLSLALQRQDVGKNQCIKSLIRCYKSLHFKNGNHLLFGPDFLSEQLCYDVSSEGPKAAKFNPKIQSNSQKPDSFAISNLLCLKNKLKNKHLILTVGMKKNPFVQGFLPKWGKKPIGSKKNEVVLNRRHKHLQLFYDQLNHTRMISSELGFQWVQRKGGEFQDYYKINVILVNHKCRQLGKVNVYNSLFSEALLKPKSFNKWTGLFLRKSKRALNLFSNFASVPQGVLPFQLLTLFLLLFFAFIFCFSKKLAKFPPKEEQTQVSFVLRTLRRQQESEGPFGPVQKQSPKQQLSAGYQKIVMHTKNRIIWITLTDQVNNKKPRTLPRTRPTLLSRSKAVGKTGKIKKRPLNNKPLRNSNKLGGISSEPLRYYEMSSFPKATTFRTDAWSQGNDVWLKFKQFKQPFIMHTNMRPKDCHFVKLKFSKGHTAGKRKSVDISKNRHKACAVKLQKRYRLAFNFNRKTKFKVTQKTNNALFDLKLNQNAYNLKNQLLFLNDSDTICFNYMNTFANINYGTSVSKSVSKNTVILDSFNFEQHQNRFNNCFQFSQPCPKVRNFYASHTCFNRYFLNTTDSFKNDHLGFSGLEKTVKHDPVTNFCVPLSIMRSSIWERHNFIRWCFSWDQFKLTKDDYTNWTSKQKQKFDFRRVVNFYRYYEFYLLTKHKSESKHSFKAAFAYNRFFSRPIKPQVWAFLRLQKLITAKRLQNFKPKLNAIAALGKKQTFGKSECFVPLAPKERLRSPPKGTLYSKLAFTFSEGLYPKFCSEGAKHMCKAHMQSTGKNRDLWCFLNQSCFLNQLGCFDLFLTQFQTNKQNFKTNLVSADVIQGSEEVLNRHPLPFFYHKTIMNHAKCSTWDWFLNKLKKSPTLKHSPLQSCLTLRLRRFVPQILLRRSKTHVQSKTKTSNKANKGNVDLSDQPSNTENQKFHGKAHINMSQIKNVKISKDFVKSQLNSRVIHKPLSWIEVQKLKANSNKQFNNYFLNLTFDKSLNENPNITNTQTIFGLYKSWLFCFYYEYNAIPLSFLSNSLYYNYHCQHNLNSNVDSMHLLKQTSLRNNKHGVLIEIKKCQLNQSPIKCFPLWLDLPMGMTTLFESLNSASMISSIQSFWFFRYMLWFLKTYMKMALSKIIIQLPIQNPLGFKTFRNYISKKLMPSVHKKILICKLKQSKPLLECFSFTNNNLFYQPPISNMLKILDEPYILLQQPVKQKQLWDKPNIPISELNRRRTIIQSIRMNRDQGIPMNRDQGILDTRRRTRRLLEQQPMANLLDSALKQTKQTHVWTKKKLKSLIGKQPMYNLRGTLIANQLLWRKEPRVITNALKKGVGPFDFVGKRSKKAAPNSDSLNTIITEYLTQDFWNDPYDKNNVTNTKLMSINPSVHYLTCFFDKTQKVELDVGLKHEQKQIIYCFLHFFKKGCLTQGYKPMFASKTENSEYTKSYLWSLTYQQNYLPFLESKTNSHWDSFGHFKGIVNIELQSIQKFQRTHALLKQQNQPLNDWSYLFQRTHAIFKQQNPELNSRQLSDLFLTESETVLNYPMSMFLNINKNVQQTSQSDLNQTEIKSLNQTLLKLASLGFTLLKLASLGLKRCFNPKDGFNSNCNGKTTVKNMHQLYQWFDLKFFRNLDLQGMFEYVINKCVYGRDIRRKHKLARLLMSPISGLNRASLSQLLIYRRGMLSRSMVSAFQLQWKKTSPLVKNSTLDRLIKKFLRLKRLTLQERHEIEVGFEDDFINIIQNMLKYTLCWIEKTQNARLQVQSNQLLLLPDYDCLWFCQYYILKLVEINVFKVKKKLGLNHPLVLKKMNKQMLYDLLSKGQNKPTLVDFASLWLTVVKGQTPWVTEAKHMCFAHVQSSGFKVRRDRSEARARGGRDQTNQFNYTKTNQIKQWFFQSSFIGFWVYQRLPLNYSLFKQNNFVTRQLKANTRVFQQKGALSLNTREKQKLNLTCDVLSVTGNKASSNAKAHVRGKQFKCVTTKHLFVHQFYCSDRFNLKRHYFLMTIKHFRTRQKSPLGSSVFGPLHLRDRCHHLTEFKHKMYVHPFKKTKNYYHTFLKTVPNQIKRDFWLLENQKNIANNFLCYNFRLKQFVKNLLASVSMQPSTTTTSHYLSSFYTVADYSQWNDYAFYIHKPTHPTDQVIPNYVQRAFWDPNTTIHTGGEIIQQYLLNLSNHKQTNSPNFDIVRYFLFESFASIYPLQPNLPNFWTSLQAVSPRTFESFDQVIMYSLFIPLIKYHMQQFSHSLNFDVSNVYRYMSRVYGENDASAKAVLSETRFNRNLTNVYQTSLTGLPVSRSNISRFVQHMEFKLDEIEHRIILAKKLALFSNIIGNYMVKLNRVRKKLIARLKLLYQFMIHKQEPAWFTINYVPVIPPGLRPVVSVGSGQVAVSDLNKLYQKIIFRNDRFGLYIPNYTTREIFGATTSMTPICIDYWGYFFYRLLQEAVDGLIENGKSGVMPFVASNNRPFKSLSDMLKGKQGRFRLNLLGKRVDYSGRSVIVVGPLLKLHQCGLPKEMAIILFQPFLIRRLLQRGFASNVIDARERIQQKQDWLWDLLEKDVMQHRPILLNRAPTLHRVGVQAFVPKLVQGRAILLHPLVCTAFNADFDGDQMAVHIPLSVDACSECWTLMFSRTNLLSPATGDVMITPTQDMILGCYYLTNLDQIKHSKFVLQYQKTQKKQLQVNLSGCYGLFNDVEQVIQALDQNKIHYHDFIWLKWQNELEFDHKKQAVIEVRMDCHGNMITIYPDMLVYYNQQFNPCFPYLSTYPGFGVDPNKIAFDGSKRQTQVYFKTTPGRVMLNDVFLKQLFNTTNKIKVTV